MKHMCTTASKRCNELQSTWIFLAEFPSIAIRMPGIRMQPQQQKRGGALKASDRATCWVHSGAPRLFRPAWTWPGPARQDKFGPWLHPWMIVACEVRRAVPCASGPQVTVRSLQRGRAPSSSFEGKVVNTRYTPSQLNFSDSCHAAAFSTSTRSTLPEGTSLRRGRTEAELAEVAIGKTHPAETCRCTGSGDRLSAVATNEEPTTLHRLTAAPTDRCMAPLLGLRIARGFRHWHGGRANVDRIEAGGEVVEENPKRSILLSPV